MIPYPYHHEWALHKNVSETENAVLELEAATEAKRVEKIKAILRNPVTLRSLIIRRGEGGKAHRIFRESFELLIAKEFGLGKNVLDIPAKELVDFLHRENLPEQLLNSLALVGFHATDKEFFFGMIDKILEDPEFFLDFETVIEAKHDAASWKSSKEQRYDEAIELNKWVLDECKKIGANILEQKALFGIANDKNIKYKHKVERFDKVSSDLKIELNDDYNAVRADLALAENMLEYAKLKTGARREELLKKAKEKALLTLKEAANLGYQKVEIKAGFLLSEIYREIGDERKSQSYQKRSEKLAGEVS